MNKQASAKIFQYPSHSFKFNDALTRDKVSRLSDGDLLLLAQQRKVVRLENFEVCFKGIRYCYLCDFPVAINRATRQEIEEELLNSYLA